MTTYGPIHSCQVCGGNNLQPVLFLGFLPPVNAMRPIGARPDAEMRFPAEMLYCPVCHLVQLGYVADPTIIFPPDYPYTSGTTQILRENFADLYREATDRLGLRPEDLIVDIGSNDGTLLKNFLQAGHGVLGVEPTLAAELARAQDVPTLMVFFDSAVAEQIVETHGRPTIVTAANVFAHIHGIHGVVEAIVRLIGNEGVFVSESHYLLDLIEGVQYDTIYHEHLRYYSLTSLKYLLEQHGLRIFYARRIPTHGGSLRVYASRSTRYAVETAVEQMLQAEVTAGLTGGTWIPQFRRRVMRSKVELYEVLANLVRAGEVVYGIGAPSRASTLVNYVGLDDGILPAVLEVAGSKKVGKYMPGTRIPVLEESLLYRHQPAYALLLSWHIAHELSRNLTTRGFRGDFIVPLPEPRILTPDQVAVI